MNNKLKTNYRQFQVIFSNAGALVYKRKIFYLQAVFVIIVTIIFLIPLQLNSSNSVTDRSAAVHSEHYHQKANKKASPNEILLENIKRYNDLQTILNKDKFSPLRNDSVVIIVQVHKRISYLKPLIGSLAQAKNISNALLVFSHDYYDDDINKLVQSIEFCKVLQIFYPYSIQTHEHEFPGEDPNDCPRNIKREEAISRKCNNALHPDLYGHYREAHFAQPKHHFWWKMNVVFDHLKVTRDYTGLVLFIEEDHYVAKDFLHVLNVMQRQSHELCDNCNILSLGAHVDSLDYFTYKRKKFNEVEGAPWVFGKHNMGFAFNRSTWNDISSCAKQFCTYDDYNYDWSLQFISDTCLSSKLHVMVAVRPRVFHVGECGLHQHTGNCQPDHIISNVKNILNNKSQQILVKKFTITTDEPPEFSTSLQPNGGWADIRDHNLCLSYTAPRK